MSDKLNIIIDTDPGTDDALALGVASVFFKDNIRAIISTYGNVDGEQTYNNLLNLAGLLKIDTHMIKGSLNPLKNKSFIPTDYHGSNGLCGLTLPFIQNVQVTDAKREPYNGDFVRELYDIIKEREKIKYIAIGPLTNLALLLDRFPDSADYIDEAVIMGGGFKVSNMPHNTEYNFSMDPVAVRKVIENSCVDKKIAPLDMTHEMTFSLADIEDITGVKRELLFNDMNDNDTADMSCPFNVLAKLFYLNYDTSIKHNEPGALIHDANTLAYLIDKSKCGLHQYKILPDEYGALTKNTDGDGDGIGHYAFVIEKMNRDFVKNLLTETFKAIKEGTAI